MGQIKHSALLNKVIDAAQRIGNKQNATFTAERFIISVIDLIKSGTEQSEELLATEKIIRGIFSDIDATRAILLEYVNKEDTNALMDEIYMKMKIREASEELSKNNGTELDTPFLVLNILRKPNRCIQSAKSSDTELDLDKMFDEMLAQKKSEQSGSKSSPSIDTPPKTEKAPQSVKQEISDLISEVKRIREELHDSIFGQDNAINVFVTGYFQARLTSMFEKARKRPSATFLFAGPPGVGKTFLAEKVAETLKLPFGRFDMSEYSDKEANIEFCGSDKVYKNGKEGNVTSFVSANPKCVLLFDEIEKANINVIHLFLQMLDAGRLRDNFTDKEVSFSDAIIILTTNAGRKLYEDSETGDFSSVSRKVIMKALQNDVNAETGTPFFPSAICSRFASGNVVMFNHIDAHILRTIAQKEIERHTSNFESKTGIKIQLDDRVPTALLFSEGARADARTVRSRAEMFFNDELYELLRLIETDKVKTSVNNIESIKINADLTRTAKEIADIFIATEKTKVLILASPETVAFCKNKISQMEFFGSNDYDTAEKIIKSQNVDIVLLDVKYGVSEKVADVLNIEDVDSPAREFLRFLKEHGMEAPVYLISEDACLLSDEEKVSFLRQGIRDVLCITEEDDSFEKQIGLISETLYQQANMKKLAKANKLISFETAQKISEDGKTATITLFDFKMEVAIDSEDSKSILSTMSRPDVFFEDVLGANDAKKELEYFVKYLKNSKQYMGTGVKAPKGVILYGPPGTGKTMLAKAMAAEAGVTFIASEGNQFIKKYIGEGSEKVHELFKTARKYAPSILFIDEIDAIAKERTGGSSASAEIEATLTAFLSEMDGFVSDPSKPVFVLAATNFNVEPGTEKSLDPALMRRFDRRIYIDLPNKEDRIKFIRKRIGKTPALNLSEELINNIAMRSTGMSLANLDSVIELALRSAIREGNAEVTDAILEEAFETFNSGEVKKWDASQLERVARHEAGHAFICWHSGETPSYLTVVARADHGGYMQHDVQEGKAIYTKDEILAKVRTSLGGRAAEIVYYGDRDGISTGAGGDLENATSTAMRIICTYGMDDEFGLATINYSAASNGEMSVEVRNAVNQILSRQMEEAIRLISENKDKVDALVNALLEKNYLNKNEINTILS